MVGLVVDRGWMDGWLMSFSFSWDNYNSAVDAMLCMARDAHVVLLRWRIICWFGVFSLFWLSRDCCWVAEGPACRPGGAWNIMEHNGHNVIVIMS